MIIVSQDGLEMTFSPKKFTTEFGSSKYHLMVDGECFGVYRDRATCRAIIKEIAKTKLQCIRIYHMRPDTDRQIDYDLDEQ